MLPHRVGKFGRDILRYQNFDIHVNTCEVSYQPNEYYSVCITLVESLGAL